MPNLCIVETQEHPAPGFLQRLIPGLEDFRGETVGAVPEDLASVDVLILNNIPATPDSLPEEQVLHFVEGGGGVFSIHDTVFPYSPHRRFIASCGIRYAFDAVQSFQTPDGVVNQALLALANPDDPAQRFPVRPIPEGAGHPILEGVPEFELAEEVWAQNLATGVRPLMSVEVADRVPSHPRFRQPIPVSACRTLERGRLAFFSLGHFAAMYENQSFLRLCSNAVRWLAGLSIESQWRYDLFLAYSSRNRDQARVIRQCGERMGVRIFMDERELEGGDIWDETIRAAVQGSREFALLATRDSLRSEWVMTEWGAAWALGRRITPLLYRCDVDDLPDRLRRCHAVDWNSHELFLTRVHERGGA
jgi:Trehalose utilisation/TIR domain